MVALLSVESENPLRSLCEAWVGRAERARQHRSPWYEIAQECEMFYSAACGFLWDPKYKYRFWNSENGAVNPTFKITIARAFELVALFRPTLYWANPTRLANPRDFPEIPPAVFGAVDQDPNAKAMYDQALT